MTTTLNRPRPNRAGYGDGLVIASFLQFVVAHQHDGPGGSTLQAQGQRRTDPEGQSVTE